MWSASSWRLGDARSDVMRQPLLMWEEAVVDCRPLEAGAARWRRQLFRGKSLPTLMPAYILRHSPATPQALNAEYEHLLSLGAENGVSRIFPSGTFMAWCMLPTSSGFIVLYDWEHHLKDYKSAFLQGDAMASAVIEHTIYHWESFFAGVGGPSSIQQIADLYKQSVLSLEEATRLASAEFAP